MATKDATNELLAGFDFLAIHLAKRFSCLVYPRISPTITPYLTESSKREGRFASNRSVEKVLENPQATGAVFN